MFTNANIYFDSDIMRVVNANKILPDDTPLDVLRRLLKLDKAPEGWFAQGVFLPNGTKVRMGYSDDPTLNGDIRGGQWHVKGQKFASPSTAATAFVKQKRGRKAARVNGWLYWQVLPPGKSDWVLLDSLRITAAMTGHTGAGGHHSGVVPFRRAGQTARKHA